jgi:hypothetical protein
VPLWPPEDSSDGESPTTIRRLLISNIRLCCKRSLPSDSDTGVARPSASSLHTRSSSVLPWSRRNLDKLCRGDETPVVTKPSGKKAIHPVKQAGCEMSCHITSPARLSHGQRCNPPPVRYKHAPFLVPHCPGAAKPCQTPSW